MDREVDDVFGHAGSVAGGDSWKVGVLPFGAQHARAASLPRCWASSPDGDRLQESDQLPRGRQRIGQELSVGRGLVGSDTDLGAGGFVATCASSKPEIEYAYTKRTVGTYAATSKFERDTESWPNQRGRPPIPGLVIYAQVDGGFSVWDPARNYWKGENRERPDAYHFQPDEVWGGLPKDKPIKLCNGLHHRLGKLAARRWRGLRTADTGPRGVGAVSKRALGTGAASQDQLGRRSTTPNSRHAVWAGGRAVALLGGDSPDRFSRVSSGFGLGRSIWHLQSFVGNPPLGRSSSCSMRSKPTFILSGNDASCPPSST